MKKNEKGERHDENRSGRPAAARSPDLQRGLVDRGAAAAEKAGARKAGGAHAEKAAG